MKTLALTAISGASLTLALTVSAPAHAATDSVNAATQTPQFVFDAGLHDIAAKGKRGGNRAVRGGSGKHNRWGNRVNGRWHAGMRAPGGYAAYRRPFRGYILPTYWHNRGFSINDYRVYYLRAPEQGYRWSRYYDDAVLTDDRGYVYDSVSNVDWDRGNTAYQEVPYDRNVLTYDDNVYGGERVYTRSESGTYDGTWDGAYVDNDGRVYQGQWNGTYVDENGQVYEGQYTGTMQGEGTYRPVNANSGATYDRREEYREVRREAPRYEIERYETERRVESDYSRYGDDAYDRCRKDNGIGGAVIGGVVGGIAGNRIAGRGNRTGGTLIGAGVGAVAGAVIDQAEDRGQCDRYIRQVDRRPVARRPVRQPRPEDYGYSGGYIQNGYYYPPQQQYYYPQAPQVTTVIVDGGASETTTTTTTYYEDVAVQPKKHKRYKTLKKPGCKC